MTTKLAIVSALCAIAIVALAVADCGGGGRKFPEVLQVKEGGATPILANSELSVGPNRFALGVLNGDGQPIVDAKVHLAFYELNGARETKRFEMDAVSRVPARDAGVSEQVVQILPDGTRHIQLNAGDDIGIYTAMVTFDRPGDWGVEIKLDAAKPAYKTTLRPRFNVLAQSPTPGIGTAAPLSRNLTVNDVTDITQIDSSANPSPLLHTSTIADAVAAGKPTLVLFAVPGYCESRLCGPEIEIMRKLAPKYESKSTFIHVEFYKNPSSPSRVPVDAVREWNLRTEPWFFVIDAKGIIRAKFEGPTSMDELDQAMQSVTSP